MRALSIISLSDYKGRNRKDTGRIKRNILETHFEAITRCNQAFLAIRDGVPLLYASGVRYRRDPSRMAIGELWLDIPAILKRGYDDCEGLASFLAAELRMRAPNSVGPERRPMATVVLKTTRHKGLLHAVVKDLDTGEIFDPSRK